MTTEQAQIDAIMEQAQVFASAWSLVGSRFDSGSGYQRAEEQRAVLREMVAAYLDRRVEQTHEVAI